LESRRARFGWTVVAFAAATLADAQVRARDAGAAAAAGVVGALYKGHFARGQRWDITFERERARFAAPLLRKLDEDATAQKATPGEVVGLDHDPLTNSQEGADSYALGAPRIEKGEALVPVEIRIGESRRTLTLRLVGGEGRWRISNIHDGQGDLVATLEQLKALR
jgi:hypothetical protein